MKKKSCLLKFSAVLLLFTCPALFTTVSAQFKQAENVKCRIELLQQEFKAADRLVLKYTISNTSAKPINILKWNTPLEGINADIFNVMMKDERAIYLGRTIKRGKPTPEDYVTIKPGEAMSGEVNLGENYFISQAGDYSIELKTVILDLGYDDPAVLSAKQTFESSSLGSNKATFRLTEDKKLPEPIKLNLKEDFSPKSPAFVNCNDSQKASINQALTNAGLYSWAAWLSLVNAPAADRPTSKIVRYNTWFGVYNATNYNTVSNHYDAIYKALTEQIVTFHCDCNDNYYAYVYPSQPYDIYLCKLFWSAPDVGTDSKFGTIIHETSHFYVVAQTHDYIYGQAGAKSLAINDPSKAISNADNHEYYAENTPSLSMPVGLKLTIFSLILVCVIGGTILIIKHRKIQAR